MRINSILIGFSILAFIGCGEMNQETKKGHHHGDGSGHHEGHDADHPGAALPHGHQGHSFEETETMHYESEKHFSNVKQLTYGGDNAEAYWSFNDDKLVFFKATTQNGVMTVTRFT